MKSILDGVTIGTAGRADAHDLTVAEAEERIHMQVEETAVQASVTHTCKLACNELGSCAARRYHTQDCDGVDFLP